MSVVILNKHKPKIISFFSGAGGLDLGFEKAGFEVVWANEYDQTIWKTYQHNFPKTYLEKRNIADISITEIPSNCDGIIGGPPCQSWSAAGAKRGKNDHRGMLFFKYIEIIKVKKPKFFLAENVLGLLAVRNRDAYQEILNKFKEIGYRVVSFVVNSHDYGVPQDRKRVIIVGYRNDLDIMPLLPKESSKKNTLKDVIFDLRKNAKPGLNGSNANKNLDISNHEFAEGGFSYIFMSRNRVRTWNEPSFTIQAGSRHIPIHPSAPKMLVIEKDVMKFVEGMENKYRRLSIRECARIQTFPDNHLFIYSNLNNGYKMIGNAVPVALAKCFAREIYSELFKSRIKV